MTTPETRARLRGVEQQLAARTPEPLAGQTEIPLTWQQPELWDPRTADHEQEPPQ